MRFWVTLLFLLLAGTASAVTDNEALALAAADLKTLPREDQIYVRYVWILTADLEDLQAVSFAMNLLSRASVPIRPLPIGKGPLMLARVDLRAYAPKAADLAEFIATWEELQFEPLFNLLLTKDTLKFAGALAPKTSRKVKKMKSVKVPHEPYVADDGLTYDYVYEKREVEEVVEGVQFDADTDLVRIVSDDLDKQVVATLIQGTQSQAPVVSHPYFLTRALRSFQSNNQLYKTIYGGLYYRFAGIKTGFKKGTDEDNILAKLGIGNIEQGVTAKQVFDELGSDQRLAVFRSKVTGKPRRVDLLKTLAGRDSQGIVSITHDLNVKSIDIGQHPIMNLLNFKDDAREGIAEKPNGLHQFFLTDGAGKLITDADADVAIDNLIPAPHGGKLEPAISCIRCHGKEGGWRIVTNDAKKLLSGYIDVFGDISERSKTVPEVVDRLAGLYAGDLERRVLPRGRQDYASAVLRATGPWKRSKDQTNLVPLVSAKVSEIYAAYNYDMIDAYAALQDFGIKCEKKDAVDTLKRLLPPGPVVIDGLFPVDPRLGSLMAGLSIPRVDWDLVRGFAAPRLAKAAMVNRNQKEGIK